MKTSYFLSIFIAFISSPLVMAADNLDAQRPNEHFCPITLDVMGDPVVALDGNSYERYAIFAWLQTNPTSPITRMPMDTTLIPNRTLKKTIEDWPNGNASRNRESAAPLVRNGIAVPEIARGHEEFYLRFIKGKLTYRLNPDSDVGKIELPFAALTNPLEGTFDLSQCGDAGQYLSISTGSPKQEKSTNSNTRKVWIIPRFMIKKELLDTTQLLRPSLPEWTLPSSLIDMFSKCGALELTSDNFLIILDMENPSSTTASARCGFDLVW